MEMPRGALRAGGPGHTRCLEGRMCQVQKPETSERGAQGHWARAPDGWAHSWWDVLGDLRDTYQYL